MKTTAKNKQTNSALVGKSHPTNTVVVGHGRGNQSSEIYGNGLLGFYSDVPSLRTRRWMLMIHLFKGNGSKLGSQERERVAVQDEVREVVEEEDWRTLSVPVVRVVECHPEFQPAPGLAQDQHSAGGNVCGDKSERNGDDARFHKVAVCPLDCVVVDSPFVAFVEHVERPVNLVFHTSLIHAHCKDAKREAASKDCSCFRELSVNTRVETIGEELFGAGFDETQGEHESDSTGHKDCANAHRVSLVCVGQCDNFFWFVVRHVLRGEE